MNMNTTEQKKSGFVTLIGRPNVGKSTLMNHIIGHKIAITSAKPQTTRMRIRTVLTTERGQIIFVDTPGIHRAKNKLGEYMVKAAEQTIGDVDVILWLVEPSDFIGAGERHILDELKKTPVPVILVINKADLSDPAEIARTIEMYKDTYDFAEIIPVSAVTGLGTEELVSLVYDYLPEGPMFYAADDLTDQPERQIMAELIREKALNCLHDEIPHGIAVSIEKMTDRDDRPIVDIDAVIICEKDSHKGMIIGRQGAMLKKIGSAARFEMERFLKCKVNLHLWVKVKKDWRDSDYPLKNFGFAKKEL